jgi:prophage DNA circulation protein
MDSGYAKVLAIYDYDPGLRPSATTATRLQEQTNFDAAQRLIQQLALLRAAELALDETFDSYDAAVAARDTLTDKLDDQADLATDDTYPLLTQLRADLVKAIPGSGNDLPHLIDHTPIVTVPSLVLAYKLYGNLDLESDLVARNNLRHPGFVQGGQVLEVLSA